MNRETQFAVELDALRTLCDQTATRDEQQKLIQSLSELAFVEPEHQVVFESIRALFSRGRISVTQLTVHLNNRGFPDTDVESYFSFPATGQLLKKRSDRVKS